MLKLTTVEIDSKISIIVNTRTAVYSIRRSCFMNFFITHRIVKQKKQNYFPLHFKAFSTQYNYCLYVISDKLELVIKLCLEYFSLSILICSTDWHLLVPALCQTWCYFCWLLLYTFPWYPVQIALSQDSVEIWHIVQCTKCFQLLFSR